MKYYSYITKVFAFFLLLVFFSMAYTNSAYAGVHTIRVGLSSGMNKVDFFIYSGLYQLLDGGTGLPVADLDLGTKGKVIKEGFSLKIDIEGSARPVSYKGPLIMAPVDPEETNVFAINGDRFRGSLILYNKSEGMLAVNILNVEDYLYGVVGREMGVSAPLEALKAQAVASRSYALSSKNSSNFYDVGVDQMTQVYGGYGAEMVPGAQRVMKAVDATSSVVLFYDDKLVRAFYHANAGGHTEDMENVWLSSIPYIKGVPSPQDVHAYDFPNQSQGWPANTYKWEKKLERQEFDALVEQWVSRDPHRKNAGIIEDINLDYSHQGETSKDSISGRVTRLDLIGSEKVLSTYRDNIRSVFGLRSTLFDVKLDSTLYILTGSGDQLQTNAGKDLIAVSAGKVKANLNDGKDCYYVEGRSGVNSFPVIFENVVFLGQGHGHGAGMSQWGARGMAVQGADYKEILEHYYGSGTGKLVIAAWEGAK